MAKTITVTGMSCEGCEEAVEDAASAISGVESVQADHTNDSATIDGDPNLEEVLNAIEDAGYDASP